MALGALLNSLASVSSSLSVIGSTMSTLGTVASSIGKALSKAFTFAGKAARKIFDEIKEAFEPLTQALRSAWDSTVMPIWDMMKKGAMIWIYIFRGEWGKALRGIGEIWKNIIGGIMNSLDKTISKLKNAVVGAFNVIGDVWGFISKGISDTIGKIFGTITRAIKSIINIGQKVIGGIGDVGSGIIDKVRGKESGGGGDSPSGGSGGHTFNMTFNLSGLTDRTDKRELAREISDLVQQEMSRGIGGVGRGR